MGASRVVEMLRHFTRQGYHVALDDCGIGMSTVAGLQRLSLSAVKIDPAITREWASDSGRVLIQSVIGLSKPMGVQVIAEGVETVPQQRMLQQLGCHAEQGWLFSPALPAVRCRDGRGCSRKLTVVGAPWRVAFVGVDMAYSMLIRLDR